MLKKIFFLVCALCICRVAYCQHGGWNQGDLRMQKYSIDGDQTEGLAFDPDSDSENEVIMTIGGGMTLSDDTTIDGTLSVSNGVLGVDHGATTGLLDDDHTQYALVDGSRTNDFTGDLDMQGNVSITDCLTVGESNLVVNALGNVGIGTSTPGDELHVDIGSVIGGGGIRIDNGYGDASKYIRFYQDTNLIGEIDVKGRHSLQDDLPYMSFSVSDTNIIQERMRINRDGNVGIGTTDPQATLDIAGDLTISSDITVTGLPSGATQPSSVGTGQLWIDTDDQTLKVGT